jgi:hypothetical protein
LSGSLTGEPKAPQELLASPNTVSITVAAAGETEITIAGNLGKLSR